MSSVLAHHPEAQGLIDSQRFQENYLNWILSLEFVELIHSDNDWLSDNNDWWDRYSDEEFRVVNQWVFVLRQIGASMYKNVFFYTNLRLARKQQQLGLEATPLNWLEPDFVLVFASWWQQVTDMAIKVHVQREFFKE